MAYKKSDFKIKKENRISVSTQLLAKPDFLTGTSQVYTKVSQNTPIQKKAVQAKSSSEEKCVLKESERQGNIATNNNINNNKNNVNKCLNVSFGRRNNCNGNLNGSRSREEVDEFEIEGVCRLDGLNTGTHGISSNEVVTGNKKLVKRQKSVVVASRYMQSARLPLKSTSKNNDSNNNSKNNTSNNSKNNNNSNNNNLNNNNSNTNYNTNNNSDSKKNSSKKDTEKKGLFCGKALDTHIRTIKRSVSLRQPSQARQLFVRKLETRGQQTPTTLKQQHSHQPSSQQTTQTQHLEQTIQPKIQPIIQPHIQPTNLTHTQPAIQPHIQPTSQPHTQPTMFQPTFTPIIPSKCPSSNTTLKTSSFTNPPSHPTWISSTPNFISSPQDMRLFSSMQSDDISHISHIKQHNILTGYSLDESELNQTTVNPLSTSILKKQGISLSINNHVKQQSQQTKQPAINKKEDPWLMYNRYIQYFYMEAKLQDCIKKQTKQAMDQIYKLWQLNDQTAAEAAEFEEEVMKLRHQQKSDQVIDELHELLQPMNDKIDAATQLYETLLAKKELASHKALVKNIHLFDKAGVDDNNDKGDKKFHNDLQKVLEDTDEILSTMPAIQGTNASDVMKRADILIKLNDETTEGIECSRRTNELSSKLHSLSIKEDFLKLQFDI